MSCRLPIVKPNLISWCWPVLGREGLDLEREARRLVGDAVDQRNRLGPVAFEPIGDLKAVHGDTRRDGPPPCGGLFYQLAPPFWREFSARPLC